MGPWVYSENPADPAEERKGRVYDMMREGDWRAVCQEFQVSQIIFSQLRELHEDFFSNF